MLFSDDPHAVGERRRYRANREGRLRRIAVAYARVYVKRGRLKREPCLVCGAADAQMHHADYRKPLAVTWLCRVHHGWLHALVRVGAVAPPVSAVDDRQLSFYFMTED